MLYTLWAATEGSCHSATQCWACVMLPLAWLHAGDCFGVHAQCLEASNWLQLCQFDGDIAWKIQLRFQASGRHVGPQSSNPHDL